MLMLCILPFLLSVLVFALTRKAGTLLKISLSASAFLLVFAFLILKFAPLFGDQSPPGSLPILPEDLRDDSACE